MLKIKFDTQPCPEARKWLASQTDVKTAWENCERGDWLWWALQHLPGALPEKKISVSFARWCAKRAKKLSSAYAAYTAAYAAAYAAYTAASAYAAERERQAEWIRKHISCPGE